MSEAPPAPAPVAEVPPGYLDAEASVALLGVDGAGTVVSCNAFARELLGFDPCGRPWRDVVVDFHGLLDPARLPPPGEGEPQLVSVRTFTGLPQTLLCRSVPAASGRLVLGSLSARDAERLRFEVLDLNRELAGLTRSLQRANAELARLGEMKTRFLGMAAHDLRRPTGAILSCAEILLDGRAGEDAADRPWLERIVASTRFMAGIIDNFLGAAVADAGRLVLRPEEVSAADVAGEALAACGPAARRKSVRIEADLPDVLPPVRADRVLLAQALLNLVANAVEHSPSGSEVSVSARADGPSLVLSVRDRGPGIPPGELGSLFEAYVPGSARKTAGERSTGLGLAIARLAVEAHGGRVEVESEPGRGSVFSLVVPFRPPSTGTSAPPAEPAGRVRSATP